MFNNVCKFLAETFSQDFAQWLLRQVVIYLKPTGSELVQQTAFAIPGTRHEFEVIRLWECPQEDLLQFPGLLPLAILSRAFDRCQ